MGLGLLWSYLVNDNNEKIGCVISNNSKLYKILKQRQGYIVSELKEPSIRQSVETIQEAVSRIYGRDRGLIAFMLGRDGLLAPSKYAGCSSNVIATTNYKKNVITSKEYFWGYCGDKAIVLSVVDGDVVYSLLDNDELLYRRRDRYYNIVYSEEKIQLRDKKMRKFGANGLSVFPPYMSIKCVQALKCNVVEKIDEGAFEQFSIGKNDAYASPYIRAAEQGKGSLARYSLLKRYGQFGVDAGVVAFVDYLYNTDKNDLEGYVNETYCTFRSGLDAMRTFLVNKNTGHREEIGNKNKLLNFLVLEDYKDKVLEPYIKQLKYNSDVRTYHEFISTMYTNVLQGSKRIEQSKINRNCEGIAQQKMQELQKRLDRLHMHYCDVISTIWRDIDYDCLEYNVHRFFRGYYNIAKSYHMDDIALAFENLVAIMGLPINVKEGVIDCLIADRYNQEILSTKGLICDYSINSNKAGTLNNTICKQIERIKRNTSKMKTGVIQSIQCNKRIVQVNALGYLILTLLQMSTPVLVAQSGKKLLQEYHYNFVNAWYYVVKNESKTVDELNHDLLTLLNYYTGDTYTIKLLKLIDVELLKTGNAYFEDCVKLKQAFERTERLDVPLHYFLAHNVKVNKNMGMCLVDKDYLVKHCYKADILGHYYLEMSRYDIGLKLMTEAIYHNYCFCIMKQVYNLQGSSVVLTPGELDTEINSICADIVAKCDNMWLWTFCMQARKYLLTPEIEIKGNFGAYLTDIASVPYRKGYKSKVYNNREINKQTYKKGTVNVLRLRAENKKVQPLYTVDDLKQLKSKGFNENTEQFLTNSIAAILKKTHRM